MNTTSLKAFAPALRRQLMEAVTRKLDFVLTAQTPDLLATFAPQVAALRQLADADRPGLVEHAAYTWFNRFAALRYLDAQGWHPFRARVLMPPTPQDTQPELLKLTRNGSLPPELAPFTEPARLDQLLDGALPSADPQGEVYRLLVLAACRFYHDLLPHVFEAIDDETELLLPDDLLTPQSVVHGFRTQISDGDCASVEVLGWLYQFYISERKDQVMARKAAVPAEDIPAVTQLFTPHWIVRYLVENSLGRLWLLNRPDSGLRAHMPYYIEDAPAEPPPWQQAWWPRIGYRENDCRTWMWLRPNLGLQDDYEATLWYAMSIDGYAYGRARWGIETLDGSGEDRVAEIERASGSDRASFEDLRYALFVIQRGIKGAEGSGPTDELDARFHAVHAALCRAWEREWTRHAAELPDLSVVGVEKARTATEFLRIGGPQEIRLLDPAVGSGHMLTYAFDLLFRIYEEEGYAASGIPGLILRHNLHGLEISPRAAQLAELALVFKARERSRTFFRPENLVRPRILALRNVRFAEGELKEYIAALGLGELFNQPMLRLMYQFEEAENFGSLIQPCLDEANIGFARRAIEEREMTGQLFLRETHRKVLQVLAQAELLTQRYQIAVANPPYMGSAAMNHALANFVEATFPAGKADLFAAFIQRSLNLTMPKGFVTMITMQSWMYLASFRELREMIVKNHGFIGGIQIGYNSFPTLNSKIAQAVAFSLHHSGDPTRKAQFINLNDAPQAADKEQVFLKKKRDRHSYIVDTSRFKAIPGYPIAYQVSDQVLAVYKKAQTLNTVAPPKQGSTLGDNDRFLRLWWEVQPKPRKWLSCLKGGEYRKWYGNKLFVVNWENDGALVRSTGRATIRNADSLFLPCIEWGRITSSDVSFRIVEAGNFFESASGVLFPKPERAMEILGLLNSKVSISILAQLNPTLTAQSGDLARLPVLELGHREVLPVDSCVRLSRTDWDHFETSWDFRVLPLLHPEFKAATLEASWQNWQTHCTDAIRQMQALETENNRLFITAYGLEDELSPEVPENQITLARADVRKDSAAFLSYAVGCMMGRYSLDQPGLVLAEAGAASADFSTNISAIPATRKNLAFAPDEDGIVPVLDGEWFEDDIVARTREFLRVTFGEEARRENVRFLETSLGKDLRRYFLTDFYRDHLQTYRKRPIYWLVQSPDRGFAVLISLHRYTRDTLNLVLNRYLREYQAKLRTRLAHLEQVQVNVSTSTRDKTDARKEGDKLARVLRECEEWERRTLLPLAQARIELDLDDGVKINYLKLAAVLAPIPGLAAREEN